MIHYFYFVIWSSECSSERCFDPPVLNRTLKLFGGYTNQHSTLMPFRQPNNVLKTPNPTLGEGKIAIIHLLVEILDRQEGNPWRSFLPSLCQRRWTKRPLVSSDRKIGPRSYTPAPKTSENTLFAKKGKQNNTPKTYSEPIILLTWLPKVQRNHPNINSRFNNYIASTQIQNDSKVINTMRSNAHHHPEGGRSNTCRFPLKLFEDRSLWRGVASFEPGDLPMWVISTFWSSYVSRVSASMSCTASGHPSTQFPPQKVTDVEACCGQILPQHTRPHSLPDTCARSSIFLIAKYTSDFVGWAASLRGARHCRATSSILSHFNNGFYGGQEYSRSHQHQSPILVQAPSHLLLLRRGWFPLQ